MALFPIGFAYSGLGDIDKSIYALEERYEIANTLKDTLLMGMMSSELGVSYLKNSDSDKALVLFQNVYDWAKATDDDELCPHALISLGIINAEIGRYKESLAHFEYARKLALFFRCKNSQW